MKNSGTTLKVLLFALMMSQSVVSSLGADSFMANAPHDDEFEQRLSRLESMLTSDGCGTEVVQHNVCEQEPSVYAGYKFLFVRPQMKESFEATVFNPVLGQNTLIPLDYDFDVTPNAWIGYKGSGAIGVRATYWGFDHDGNNQRLVSDGINLPGATATTVIYPAAIIAPAPGDVLQTHNSLNVQTIDLEGTLDLTLQSTELTFGGGLRYAATDQQMQATASRLGVPIGILSWSREFEGFGPTISASASHPIMGGLSFIGNIRGSLLYGHKDLNRTVIGDVTPPAVAGAPTVRLNKADEVVASGDLGIGLRYTQAINQQAEAFVQGTFEGQLWTEAGAPTLTFLGFQGIGLALGISY